MLRAVVTRMTSAARTSLLAPRSATAVTGTQSTRASHDSKETDEEFDERYVKFFNRSDIDHWEIRKAMNDLAGMDLVPEPKIICAALRACRRLNDFALAVRFIESVKDKAGPHVNTIYPYIVQEIKPTLDELGINTPEQLGYDEPELAVESVYHM
uniref:Cytochrome c oxidase subunit 5A, mitochondrial n=1 Tax=Odontomachus monticola TaxID=613454 RepID=A0A348G665_ODOMO